MISSPSGSHPTFIWLSAIFKSIFSFPVSVYRTEVVLALGAIYILETRLKSIMFFHLNKNFQTIHFFGVNCK